MDGCAAGTHFKNSYRALTSVGFVQRTRLRQTWRYVRESRDNASVGIEPHQIQRESHPLHPDRMPVRRLPLQKQTIDFRESVASGQTFSTRGRCISELDANRSCRCFERDGRKPVASVPHPHGSCNQGREDPSRD